MLVHPMDRVKTGFTCAKGLFQYRRMPFGLVNAPSSFQRMMAAVLAGLKGVQVYVDDIIIWTETLEQHTSLVEQVLERLNKAGLTINSEKSEWFMEQVDYLGHTVAYNSIKMNADRVRDYASKPVPRSVKMLRSVLGAFGYYRRFIPRFSDIAVPLYDLTKEKNWHWDQRHQEAFELLKEHIVRDVVLATPRYGVGFCIKTDASDIGLGATLSQEENGIHRPLAFISRSFSSAERNYNTTQRELLGLVFALTYFSNYIDGQQVKLLTDHQANIYWLHNQVRNNKVKGRIVRWDNIISYYMPNIQHIAGRDLPVEDDLSRYPYDSVTMEVERYHDERSFIDVRQVNAITRRPNNRDILAAQQTARVRDEKMRKERVMRDNRYKGLVRRAKKVSTLLVWIYLDLT